MSIVLGETGNMKINRLVCVFPRDRRAKKIDTGKTGLDKIQQERVDQLFFLALQARVKMSFDSNIFIQLSYQFKI